MPRTCLDGQQIRAVLQEKVRILGRICRESPDRPKIKSNFADEERQESFPILRVRRKAPMSEPEPVLEYHNRKSA